MPKIEPIKPIFKDTKTSISSQDFTEWGEIFIRFKEGDYPIVILPSDPCDKYIDVHVFPNIRKYHLHNVVYRTPMIPGLEVIGWIIDHTYVNNITLLNQTKEDV
jgi:hypothetical protein